jgi:hypothetical protein
MMRRLMDRESSLLASQEWLDVAEVLSKSDAEHQICDFGLRLSVLVQTCDTVLQKQNKSMAQVKKLLNNIGELFQSLDRWHRLCTCFQLQPTAGPRALHAKRCMQSSFSPNIEAEKQHIRCILLTAMQLLCCMLVGALMTWPGLTQVGSEIEIEPFSTMAFHSRHRFVGDIIRLSKVFVAEDATIGNLSCVVWALNLVHQGCTSPETDTENCDALLQTFTEIIKSRREV